MNRFITTTLFSLLMLSSSMVTSCSAKTIKGSDNIIKREVSISDFDEVSVSTGIRVVYTTGAKAKATIQAPDNIMEYVRVSNDGNELNIGLKRHNGSINFNGNFAVTVYISSRALHEVETSSGSSFTANGLSVNGDLDLSSSSGSSIRLENVSVTNDLDLDSSSGSTITIEGAKAAKIDIDASSASSVNVSGIVATVVNGDTSSAAQLTLKGKCERADFEASSSSTIHASALTAKSGSAESSSAASISCNVTDLRSSTSSAGSVNNKK